MIDPESLTSLVDKDVLRCLFLSRVANWLQLWTFVLEHSFTRQKPENYPLCLNTYFNFRITLFVAILSQSYYQLL